MKSILFKTAIPSAIILLPWSLFLFGFPIAGCFGAVVISWLLLFIIDRPCAKETVPFFGLLLVAIMWQAVYYLVKGETTTDIFRGVYENSLAPLYGKSQIFRPWMWVLLFSFVPMFFKEKINNTWIFISMAVLLLFSFNISDGPRRIEKYKSHIETFTEGRTVYPQSVDWSSYADQMGQLGVHNDHYPPLPLTLLNLFGSHALLFSIFLMVCALLCMILLKKWVGPEIALTLPPLLFFTTFTWVPVHLLFVLSIMMASKSENRFLKIWAPGLILGVYAFFSFGFFVIAALFFGFQWADSQSLKKIKTIISQLGIALILVLIISWATGYHYLDAFEKARHLNDQLLDQPSYYTPFLQGIYRSLGNLLSFFFVLGPLVFITFFRFRGKELWLPLLALVAMAFSGLFYMETERVWVFFIPFLFFFSALKKPIPLYLYTSQIIFIILIEAKVDLSFGAFY